MGTTCAKAPLVTGDFQPDEVRPFARPAVASNPAASEFVFFLSHRGPDTKQDLVKPLSFILKELGVPHFFDQNDEAMELGKINSDQMAEAAWSCRVGVVVLSDHFAKSKWCLRELNTFLLRRYLSARVKTTPADVLIPVYFADHLVSSKLYDSHCSRVSSVVRKQTEDAREFLVSLVPRLLSIRSLQLIPCVEAAHHRVNADPFLVKDLFNKYASEQAEHKLFDEPPGRKEMHIIQKRFKALVPMDIKAGLEVYQPLEYSLVPSVNATRFSLESISINLLQGKPIVLGNEFVDEKDDSKKPTPVRPGVLRTSTFTSSPPKMLLIQGAAGSGKSLFGWELCSRYYRPQAKDVFTALPLFVSLPVFRKQIFSDPSQLLPSYFFTTYEIKDATPLHNQPLVIVLDGLDELGDKINLFKACGLHVWTHTTFIITCRSDFLQDSDILQYLTPTNPVTAKAEPSWLGKLYLLPFSAEQRAEYISKFAVRYQEIYHWEAQQYISVIENAPQLAAFLHEPLLLFMVLSVLPQFHLGSFSISASVSSPSSPSLSSSADNKVRRLDPYLLEVQPIQDITWTYPQFRRAELYALFVDGWTARETARLPVDRRPTSQQVVDFCSKLAFEMFLHTQTSVTIVDAHTVISSPASPPSRVDRLKAKKAAQGIVGDSWAAELFAEHENERACSPLRKSSERYGFLHKSLQEYFTARYMASDLVDRIVFEESTWNASPHSSISESHISRKRVTSDYAVLRFAAELVDQRIRSYRPHRRDSQGSSDSKSAPADDFQPYGRALFDILHANLHPVASCNAISILNAAGVGFQARDFTGLDLSSDLFPSNPSSASAIAQNEQKAAPFASRALVPLADLSGANLNGCKLLDAKLCGVRLENACLDDADIRGAAMEQAIFGQSSMFLGHTSVVYALVISLDGRWLFSGSGDKTIRQWSAENGISVRVFEGHSDDVLGLALSTNSKTLFSCSTDCTIRQWEVETGSLIQVLTGHTVDINVIILSRDERTLFSGSDDKTICLWSIETGAVLRVFHGHSDSVLCLTLSDDGQTLYSGSSDKTIQEWSVDGSELRVLYYYDGITRLVLSPDGKALFSASLDSCLQEWSLDTGKSARNFRGHSQAVLALCLSRDGKSLFSAGADKSVCQWSVDAGSLVRSFEGHTDIVCTLALSMDGATLFSGAADNTIRQWAIDVGSLARVAEGHTDYVTALALNHSNNNSNGSKRLYSSSKDCAIREWCVETGTVIRVLGHQRDSIWSTALSSDGQTLYSGCGNGWVAQWSLASGSFSIFSGHDGAVGCLVLSGDDKMIFSGSADNTVRSWSTSTGSSIRVFQGHTDVVSSLAVSLDNMYKMLFSGSADKTIRQWRVDTGSVERVLKGHDGDVYALALSSDCQMLYSGSDDTTIRQWALDNGSVVRVLKGHTGPVYTILLSSQDKILFSGDNGTIRAWSVDTGTVDFVVEGPSDGVLSLALSSDMQTLFACGADRSIREWSLVSSSFSAAAAASSSSSSAAAASSSSSAAASSSALSFPSFSALPVWSSGPWSLSARHCKLDDDTRLAPRSRLLLTQCGAINNSNNNKNNINNNNNID